MRLTVKDNEIYCFVAKPETIAEQKQNCFNKLGQLEDIEEELGVNLVTLFKAVKNGLYYRFYKNDKISKMKVPMLRIIDGEYCWICPKWTTVTWMNVKIKDYGKTWALTREELENEEHSKRV